MHANLQGYVQIIIVDWCCMCKSNGESVDPLLLHCPIAKELWDMLLCLLGVSWVMPLSVCAVLDSWKGSVGHGRCRGVMVMAPPCLMWCIWKERNQHTF